MEHQSLSEWYDGQTVFLTGATGFLGKAIMEKLLRTTNIKKVYILARPKKNKTMDERMKEILSNPLIKKLAEEVKGSIEKISMVNGEISQPGLNLMESDRKNLVNEVTLVIHSAATIKFNEKLKFAIDVNVKGTKNILDMCKEMQELKSVVYISTAFSQCTNSNVELQERLYNLPIYVEDFLRISDTLNEEKLEMFGNSIAGDWPNTYTLTKAMAEDLVNMYKDELKVAILRPAVVMGSFENLPGWTEGLSGGLRLMASLNSGLLRVLHADPKINVNLIPVDMTANCTIAIARHTANKCTSDVPVFNFSSKRNPVTMEDFMDYSLKHGRKFPLENSFWYPTLTFVKQDFFYRVLTFFYHFLPALMMDIILLVFNKDTWAVKNSEKIKQFNYALDTFLMKHWRVHDENVQVLFKSLSTADQEKYNFNITAIDWEPYITDCSEGLRHYIFKENENNLHRAQKKMFWFKFCHRIVQAALYCIILKTLYNIYAAVWKR